MSYVISMRVLHMYWCITIPRCMSMCVSMLYDYHDAMPTCQTCMLHYNMPCRCTYPVIASCSHLYLCSYLYCYSYAHALHACSHVAFYIICYVILLWCTCCVMRCPWDRDSYGYDGWMLRVLACLWLIVPLCLVVVNVWYGYDIDGCLT